MRELKSVEEKILDRALYLIGKNRTLDVSVRAIAKEASVNVSAINYYFRTKEEMLRQIKQFYLTNTLTISSTMDNEDADKEEKLIVTANEIMEYILRYPGVTVILREAANLAEIDETSVKIIKATKEMHEKIGNILNDITKDNKMANKHKLMIFMASITHPIENNDIMEYGDDLMDSKENRMDYIRSIIKALKTE